MIPSSFRKTLILSAITLCATITSANAQTQLAPSLQQNASFQRSSQMLGIPTSFCGHVMDLMMHNRIRQQTGRIGTPEIHLPHLTVGTATGDLAICGVHLVTEATDCCGPAFQVTLQNNSIVPIGNFDVAIVGVLGRITPISPMAEQTVARMEPGQQVCITLQLPVTCLSMGPAHQLCPFDTLVVAADSRDCLMENDELNNVQLLPRASIGTVVVLEQPASPQPPPAPAPSVSQSPQFVTPVAPGERNPLDNIDLDNLDLQNPDSEPKQSLKLSFR